jgi:hypothetical protein
MMEVAIKVPLVKAAVGTAGFLAYLAEAGAERDLEQQTTTRWALQYHAELLRAGGTVRLRK